MTVTEPEASRQIGIETAKALGLDEKTIDKIQEVPYTELLEASKNIKAENHVGLLSYSDDVTLELPIGEF